MEGQADDTSSDFLRPGTKPVAPLEPVTVAEFDEDAVAEVQGKQAAVADAELGPSADGDAEVADIESPKNGLRRIVIGLLVMVVLIIAALIAIPRIDGLNETWEKIRKGDPTWLLLGVALELVSFGGYIWLFEGTVKRNKLDLSLITTSRIVLAGVAASRVLATAGAGGIAAVIFALNRNGMEARRAAATVTAQIVIVHLWFVAMFPVFGLPLYFMGHGHLMVTLVPSIAAIVLLAVVVKGRPVLHRIADRTAGHEGKIAKLLAVVPGVLDEAMDSTGEMIKEREWALLGGLIWWLADAGVLWAALMAFGESQHLLDVYMAYLLGQVANLLPIPGGLGVEVGLVGALLAFGVPLAPAGLAATAQRLISTWLPAIPGALALAAIGVPAKEATGDPPSPSSTNTRQNASI